MIGDRDHGTDGGNLIASWHIATRSDCAPLNGARERTGYGIGAICRVSGVARTDIV